jgi:anti-anti-sigma factor
MRHVHPSFSINITRPAEALILVTVVGDLDLLAAPQFDAHLTAAVTRPDTAELVIDLTRLRFLCARGLGSVRTAYDAARARGIAFQLVMSRPFFLHLLELLEPHHQMPVRPHLDARIAADHEASSGPHDRS